MRHAVIYVWGVLLALPGMASHDPLAGLADIAADEAILVDHVRATDLEQRVVAEWEEALAAGLIDRKPEEAAKLLQKVGERHRAIQTAYEFVLARYPKSAQANNYLGEALFDFTGDETKAVELWTFATQCDPGFAPPLINLGIHYTHIGNFVDGLEAFNKAIAAEPDNPESYFHLVQVYLINWPDLEKQLDKTAPELYADAMAMSEKAARLAPGDFELARDYALNFFAGERMEASVDWAKAAEAWKRARALAPSKDMRFQTWLYEARSYIRGKDFKAAESALTAALEIDPNNGVARDLLEKTHAQSGADAP